MSFYTNIFLRNKRIACVSYIAIVTAGHNTSWFESITSRFGLAHGEESEESALAQESVHAQETLERISEEPSDDSIITSDSAIAQG